MRSFLKNNWLVLLLYVLSVATALFFMYLYQRTTIHLYLNQYVGNYFLNLFFYYVTYLGDGTVAVFILLAILFYNTRLGIYVTTSFLTASLCSIFLKEVCFDDANRPWFVFQYEDKRPFTHVEGVDLYLHNSFPSGHATQAFAIFMCLVFVTKNQFLKFVFFSIAILTAISRVYLSQHWLADITAGSVVGITFSTLFYFVFMHRNTLQHLNKPLTSLKKS